MTTLSGRGSRVQQVSRLLYKKNPMTSRADCVTSGVKRLHSDSFVTVGDATLGKPTGDVSVKKKQAWRYPGGIIQRYESTMINGRRYYDHIDTSEPVSYTHLRAHETDSYLVCRLLLEKKKTTTPSPRAPASPVLLRFFFFNDTATTEIYTLHIVGSVRCV